MHFFYMYIYLILCFLYIKRPKILASQSGKNNHLFELSFITSESNEQISVTMNIKESQDQPSRASSIESIEAQLCCELSDLSPSKPDHMTTLQFLSTFGLDDQMYLRGTCNEKLKDVFISIAKKLITFYFLYRGEYRRDYGTSGRRSKNMSLNSKCQLEFAKLMMRSGEVIASMSRYISSLFKCILYLLSSYYRKLEIEQNNCGCSTFYIFFQLTMMEIIDYILSMLAYSERQLLKLIAKFAEGSYTDSEARIQALDFALEMIRKTMLIEEEKFSRHKNSFESCKEFMKSSSSKMSSKYKASRFDTSVSEGSSSSKSSSFKRLFSKKLKGKGKDHQEKKNKRDNNEEDNEPFWNISFLSSLVSGLHDDDVFL
ncbi:uncharacterized protein ELE39_001010 [Cryptosporidium sp. chipmunk genotype I]|uniref:uncharacterized protein n=1 Tax=Cryptosporidium sp. chipmunk genotype I TaxID=1280935 RepID=UPI00351A9F0C|nr:hypothetical protein ELE39_001010 [Cryptosporidium sp. chipmunk genotype I]